MRISDWSSDVCSSDLVHPAVEVVEEHFLGERGALAQAQQLEHRIFLARQMDARAIDLDRLGIEIDRELAGLDDRLAVPLRTADDGVDARHQFVAMERLGDVIVGAEAKTEERRGGKGGVSE